MQSSEQRLTPTEERLDEAVAETFPASDAPAWNATHAGAPVPRIVHAEPTHEALRALLRADIERLSRPVAEIDRRRTREETVAHAMLAAGRAVVREPVDAGLVVRTLESEQPGGMREASCVVVGARYDTEDVSGIAALLAVSRAVSDAPLVRNVRFVAFANTTQTTGSARYVEKLARSGASVHAMISLARLDLARDHEASLLFVGNLGSGRLVRGTSRSFERASRIGVRAVTLPSWVPGVSASDHAAFWRVGWPAMMVADGPLWRSRSSRPAAPDVDRIAAAVPGLVAAVLRLAGA